MLWPNTAPNSQPCKLSRTFSNRGVILAIERCDLRYESSGLLLVNTFLSLSHLTAHLDLGTELNSVCF